MITLNKLRWSNCFSYGEDNELDLSSMQLTQIVGTNGVGKSSIPLIIEEILYNKNSKGIKKAGVLNRNIESKSYSIELEFSIDSDNYEVKLKRASSASLTLLKNGEDISSHTAVNTYKTIQSLLKLDFKAFSQLVYQSTNTSLQFLTATDTARKKFLIDLLGLEKYVEAHEVFKEAAKVYSTEVASIESRISVITKWLESNKRDDVSIKPITPVEVLDISEHRDRLLELQTELATASDTNKRISKNNNFKALLDTIDIEYANSINVSEKVSYDHLLELKSKHDSLASSARALAAKIKALGDCCHTCGQTISEEFKRKLLEEAKAEFLENNSESVKLKTEIDNIKANNSLFEEKSKIVSKFEDTYRSIDETLAEEKINISALEAEISSLKDTIEQEKLKVEKVLEDNAEAERYNTRLQVILEQTDEFLQELEEATEQLNKAKSTYNSLEILKKAFSTNGLLAYKIENLVKELEDLVNKYLAELSDGRFTIEFLVEKDKLNVNVTDDGKDIDIMELSSGELARVNTSTLLAIRKLMSCISKSQINVLFLDEIINVLDADGRDKLVEVLTNEEHLNTFIVSHQWSHPLLYKLNIVKNEGISVIENG